MKFSRRLFSKLNSKELIISNTSSPKPKPDLSKTILFGKATTDHMLNCDWSVQDGWKAPQIRPYGPLELDPTSLVFHYAIQAFQGMKAYRTVDNNIALFRPMLNMERLLKSSLRLGLPQFDKTQLLECIKKVVIHDKDWLPDKRGFSIYIRPTHIGTTAQLKLQKPDQAKLFTVLSTAGPYFPQGFQPINLYCSGKVVRSYYKGLGAFKVGGNYAPGIEHTAQVKKLGYHQLLWLIDGFVTQAGAMNFFVLWKNVEGQTELLTCPEDDLILGGITRKSIVELAKGWGEYLVTQRKFTMDELVEGLKAGRVLEIFCAGTACIVCPVQKIYHDGVDYDVPIKEQGETSRIMNSILAIQHGEVESDWCERIIQQ